MFSSCNPPKVLCVLVNKPIYSHFISKNRDLLTLQCHQLWRAGTCPGNSSMKFPANETSEFLLRMFQLAMFDDAVAGNGLDTIELSYASPALWCWCHCQWLLLGEPLQNRPTCQAWTHRRYDLAIVRTSQALQDEHRVYECLWYIIMGINRD